MTQDFKLRMLNLLNWIGADVTDPEKQTQLATVKLELQRELNSFQVTSLHRDDLIGVGLVPSPSLDMERLASKMSDDYCEQLFHQHLHTIATDGFDVLTIENAISVLRNLCTDICANPDEDMVAPVSMREFKDFVHSLDTDSREDWDYKQLTLGLSTLKSELKSYSDLGTYETYKDLIENLTIYSTVCEQ